MPIPTMPSITDVPVAELKDKNVAFKVLEEKLGEVHNPNGDGNCGYYALFLALQHLNRNLIGEKLYVYAANKSTAKAKRKQLLKYGIDNCNHFVRHHDDSTPPNIIQLIPEGHMHLFGLHEPNLRSEQDRVDAFMKAIGDSIYTEEFDHQPPGNIDNKFYMEASLTFPLFAYKYKINITLYNLDAVMTSYCYHHDNRVVTWSNAGFCKPVDKSCEFILQSGHFYFIKGTGNEVPVIDPGNLMFLEEIAQSNRSKARDDDVINLTDKDEEKCEVDSTGEPLEIMPQKKKRKFNAKEKEGSGKDLLEEVVDGKDGQGLGDEVENGQEGFEQKAEDQQDMAVEGMSEVDGASGLSLGNEVGNREEEKERNADDGQMMGVDSASGLSLGNEGKRQEDGQEQNIDAKELNADGEQDVDVDGASGRSLGNEVGSQEEGQEQNSNGKIDMEVNGASGRGLKADGQENMEVDGASGRSLGNEVGSQKEKVATDAKKSQPRGQRSNQLIERNHDANRRVTEGSTHWLQNKDRVVLDVDGKSSRDYDLPDGVFLDDNGEITAKKVSQSLPEFTRAQEEGIQYKRVYQTQEEGKLQFDKVRDLTRCLGDAGVFIKWSDVLDRDWDSPELCEAALKSNKFVFGHWQDLSALENKLRIRLDHFLKSIFTDAIDHAHIDKIMSEKETYGVLISGYAIDNEDIDIFSCLIFEFMDRDNSDSPTGIVYIATSPMFRGLNLGSLMLCILSNLLSIQNCSTTLFVSTSPSNCKWYESHEFQYVIPENKFDNDDELIPKEFANQIFQFCVRHNYLDAETGLQYNEKGEECDFMSFMILSEIHQNDRYIVTKRLYDLTRDIYFLPISESDMRIVNLSTKVIDAIISGLGKAANIIIDSTAKIDLYNKADAMLESATSNLIQLLNVNNNDQSKKNANFRKALIDPYQDIRSYISNEVRFPMSYLTSNWNTILCKLPSAYLPKNLKYRSWMSVLSKLNSIEIRGVGKENAAATSDYGLYCSCCNQFLTNSEGFSDSISNLLELMQIAVDVHYGTYCTIKASRLSTEDDSQEQRFYTSMCFSPAKFKRLADDVKARKIEFVSCSILENWTRDVSSKTLELINALKFDKLAYPSSSKNMSQWIEALFQSISRKKTVASIHEYLELMKTNLSSEFNPVISQLERQSALHANEVLCSFGIDLKRLLKSSFVKSITNKSLEQVLRDYSVDFNSRVSLTGKLSYQRGRIKSLKLFRTFSEKGPIDIKFTDVRSKADFKAALQIDKWSKGTTKKTFKTSIAFPGKSNYDITIGLPQSFKNCPTCPVPYVHPVPFSKYVQYEELPDANGWDDDDEVMKVCGPNWCKEAPDLVVPTALEQIITAKKRELGYDDTYDGDPYLQEMVLRNLYHVSIFGCNKSLDSECKEKTIWYQDRLWRSSVRIFGKCSFENNFLSSHDNIAKYLKKYAEPFEVMDCVVKQFPLKEIKSNQNKGWIAIPKSVRTRICDIANKIKGTTIRSIMPCIVAKTSASLLSVHGDNKKTLVTGIPRDSLFALDCRLLDYTSCVLFACQEEMYFGVGNRINIDETKLDQLSKFPLHCKLVFDNDDHLCIPGAFMKLCCEVLIPSECDALMKLITSRKKQKLMEADLSKMLADCGCGILVKERDILDNSTDAKTRIIDHAQSEQPFLVAIRGKMNIIGHCIGVVNNMIVDATLIDGFELSRESLDAVLGETVTEILWCRTYYPSSDKLRSDLSILTSTNIAHDKYRDSSLGITHSFSTTTDQTDDSYYPSRHYPIQCKLLFENCAGQQVLGTVIKLVGETLSFEAYALLANKVQALQRESFVGIKVCISALAELKLGIFEKNKIDIKGLKLSTKQWIMEYAKKGHPFLVAVTCNRKNFKKKKSEICIGIVNHMIVESQLLGGIDLNECNLDYIVGNDSVELIWCRTFYPTKK